MGKLYIKPQLEENIRKYCTENKIRDVNEFANRCTRQGFDVLRFGVSPPDNIQRETEGIKDYPKVEEKKEEQPIQVEVKKRKIRIIQKD